MSEKKKANICTAEFRESAVKLAVETNQPITQTARELGINCNTLHTWISNYHRSEQVVQKVSDEHPYDELKRLKKENARLKEERDILKCRPPKALLVHPVRGSQYVSADIRPSNTKPRQTMTRSIQNLQLFFFFIGFCSMEYLADD